MPLRHLNIYWIYYFWRQLENNKVSEVKLKPSMEGITVHIKWLAVVFHQSHVQRAMLTDHMAGNVGLLSLSQHTLSTNYRGTYSLYTLHRLHILSSSVSCPNVCDLEHIGISPHNRCDKSRWIASLHHQCRSLIQDDAMLPSTGICMSLQLFTNHQFQRQSVQKSSFNSYPFEKLGSKRLDSTWWI